MTPKPGPRNLITDVEGILVGHAVDRDIGTGVTVIRPMGGAVCAVDVRGGAPGATQSELLAPGSAIEGVDAIAFSGGSLYGFGAAYGVSSELGAAGIGAGLMGTVVPSVPGAIIFDLLAQRHLNWYAAPPYERLGRQAVQNLSASFDLGSVGAGFAASACSYAGGMGSASLTTDDGLVVGALAIVNSLGEVAVPGQRAFWSWPYEYGDEFGGYGAPRGQAPIAPELSLPASMRQPGASTTLVVVATNLALDKGQAHRLAVMASAGVARAIRPIHTLYDGDLTYALSTGQLRLADPIRQMQAGNMAADCVARSIARAVYHASEHRLLPTWASVHTPTWTTPARNGGAHA